MSFPDLSGLARIKTCFVDGQRPRCDRCRDCGYTSWWDGEGQHDIPCSCFAGAGFRQKQEGATDAE